ncbi:uncharacterized protein YPR063C [Kluyveromyces marxianus]|uniref:Uncharacterized protein YPR063C n=2 Tax=Kluyveromyces marxianus TaxID=4911 RepID=W0TII5_KLUMD|nr:uncharacterized protein KLMA_80335 [Kluyveromyces marxianus DMKU3-1042]QGN17910.1 YPR063C [Kluyveromyces marxianus]BAO42646.1 uncharacterized protein YPR063C [Kluyveromyces marxianus DMKU3-1042]BAP74024.1 uncharacterized protein YPR063C [Kluyveromyces marxianus]
MTLNNVKRLDLAVTYNHVPAPKSLYTSASGSQGMLNQSMPMAAMFMRNKFLAWFSVLSTWHAILTAMPDPATPGDSPLMKIGMALLALGTNYLNVLLPGSQGPVIDADKTEGAAEAVTEAVTESAASATV